MIFKVQFTPRSLLDIKEYATYLKKRSPQAAQIWLRELRTLQIQLEELPARFPVLSIKQRDHTHVYRWAPHYSHKIVYRVDESENIIYIVRVYHDARRPLESENDIES